MHASSPHCTEESEPRKEVYRHDYIWLLAVQAHVEEVTEDERAFLHMAARVADRIMHAAKGVRDAAANVLIKLGFEIHNLLCASPPPCKLLPACSRHAWAGQPPKAVNIVNQQDGVSAAGAAHSSRVGRHPLTVRSAPLATAWGPLSGCPSS